MAKILIVDDTDLVRELVAEVVSLGGHEAVTAGGGQAGIDTFEKTTFNLVIVDLVMPDMDGVQMIRKCRERAADLPVILLTGYGDCLNQPGSGMHVDLENCSVLTKPIDCDALLKQVDNALRGKFQGSAIDASKAQSK